MTRETAKQTALRHVKVGTRIRIVRDGERYTLIEEVDEHNRRYALFSLSARTVLWLDTIEEAENAALKFRLMPSPFTMP